MTIVKSFFSKALLPIWLSCFFYFLGSVFVLYEIGLWEFSLATGSVFWFVATVFYVGNVISSGFDVTRLLPFLKWQVVFFFTLNFLMDFYPLPFFWEMLVLPLLVFIAGLVAVAENDERHRGKPVHTFFLRGQASIFYLIFGFSLLGLVVNYGQLLSLEGLRSYLMVPVFSVLFIPFFYFVSAYVRYEGLILVYSFYLEGGVGWMLTFKTFLRIRFDYQLLDEWRKHANREFTLSTINSEDDVVLRLDEFISDRQNDYG